MKTSNGVEEEINPGAHGLANLATNWLWVH